MQKKLDIQPNVLFLFLKYIFMKGTKGTEIKSINKGDRIQVVSDKGV